MEKTRLKISTPNGTFFDGDVEIVTLKTSEGYIGLQRNRLPFISSIEISPMYITVDANTRKTVAIGGGIVFVEKTYIDIFTDDIFWKEDLDKSEIQRIIDEAHRKLEIHKQDNVETHKNELVLKRAMNKLVILDGK